MGAITAAGAKNTIHGEWFGLVWFWFWFWFGWLECLGLGEVGVVGWGEDRLVGLDWIGLGCKGGGDWGNWVLGIGVMVLLEVVAGICLETGLADIYGRVPRQHVRFG
jgi:hypothetical protein